LNGLSFLLPPNEQGFEFDWLICTERIRPILPIQKVFDVDERQNDDILGILSELVSERFAPMFGATALRERVEDTG
jgi:hypothetical protein